MSLPCTCAHFRIPRCKRVHTLWSQTTSLRRLPCTARKGQTHHRSYFHSSCDLSPRPSGQHDQRRGLPLVRWQGPHWARRNCHPRSFRRHLPRHSDRRARRQGLERAVGRATLPIDCALLLLRLWQNWSWLMAVCPTRRDRWWRSVLSWTTSSGETLPLGLDP